MLCSRELKSSLRNGQVWNIGNKKCAAEVSQASNYMCSLTQGCHVMRSPPASKYSPVLEPPNRSGSGSSGSGRKWQEVAAAAGSGSSGSGSGSSGSGSGHGRQEGRIVRSVLWTKVLKACYGRFWDLKHPKTSPITPF